MTVTTPLLPKEFADLEPFAADWCLPTERERFAKRYASTMDDMQAFYDAITPRAEDAIDVPRPVHARRPAARGAQPDAPPLLA